MGGIGPAWLWLAGGLLLAAAEIVSPGIFLVWIGGAALLAGLVTLALDLGAVAQVATFAACAVAAILAARTLATRYPTISDDPLLNDRGARMIGRMVIVVEPLSGGNGRVRVGDSVWNASGVDAAAGEQVRITGIEAGRLLVERSSAPHGA